MKLVFSALGAAAALHLIYFVTIFAVGYVKTITHQPNIGRAWENAEGLQNEVAFGQTVSPIWYVGTFIGTAVLCGLLLIGWRIISAHSLKTKDYSS